VVVLQFANKAGFYKKKLFLLQHSLNYSRAVLELNVGARMKVVLSFIWYLATERKLSAVYGQVWGKIFSESS
jgi:hypothetical protein